MEAEARDILRGAVEEEAAATVADPREAVRSVRGRWRGRLRTDDVMRLTRGD